MNNNGTRIELKYRKIAVVYTLICLISSVVIAINFDTIIKHVNSRSLGEGIDSAINNGYIEDPDMNYIYNNSVVANVNEDIVENIGLSTKIENFLMDDNNISIEFNFKFDEIIDEYVNLDNINRIFLDDLIVRDDNNIVLYSSAKEEQFENYCIENNLNYSNYKDDNYFFGSGLNSFLVEHSKDEKEINLIYNIYSSNYPKSRKLYFSFKNIILVDEDKNIDLKGNWNIELEVPEIMYNRKSESYKVVNCTNNTFDIYTAKVSETGFEIGFVINDIEKVEFPKELQNIQKKIISENANGTERSKEWDNILSQSPYKEIYDNYNKKSMPIFNGYVENENGEKFECTFSPSRNYKWRWIDNNRYEYYETYGMTKYNSTEKVKVVLDYYEEKVVIELEK